jgi:hypothetical protein
VSPVSAGTYCGPCTSTMAHSCSAGQPRDDTSPTLEPSVRRSSSKRRSWNEAGPYTVMPTSLVASKGSGMVLESSLACTPTAFMRPNKNWSRGERGGDSGFPLESWRKKLCSENSTRSTSLAKGSEPSMSLMRRASASVSRSASGPLEWVSPSSDVGGVGSSRRQSMPRRSAKKSRLPKRKAWKGAKMEGSHNPMRGAAGNSSELKRIVPPRLARLEVPEMEVIQLPRRWTHDVLSTEGAKLSVPEMVGS